MMGDEHLRSKKSLFMTGLVIKDPSVHSAKYLSTNRLCKKPEMAFLLSHLKHFIFKGVGFMDFFFNIVQNLH